MSEQDNQVIITLIVIKTFVSLIFDWNKINTISKLILLALKWVLDKTDLNKVG